MRPLPLAIDALDATVDLYNQLDPDRPGCCIPNELLSAALTSIAGKLTSLIVLYIDLEEACRLLNDRSSQDASGPD
jgi:hypothetical protein